MTNQTLAWTQPQALARLQSMLSWSDFPALTAAEVLDLLSTHRRIDRYGVWPDNVPTWTPATTYPVGAVVAPSIRNGHYYRVTVMAGNSGAVEPTWPLGTGAAVVIDGDTYVEAGLAPWLGDWDLNGAAAAGWLWKAGKVASMYDFRTDVTTLTRDQLQKHCLLMADRYARGILGSIDTGAQTVWDPVIGNLNGGV